MSPAMAIHNLETPPRPPVRDRALDFDNIFCPASLGTVAKHLWEIEASLLARGKTVFYHIGREPVIPDFRDMYLYPLRADATVLWIWSTMTECLAMLSQRLQIPIVYLSFTGYRHQREFVAFDQGNLVHEVLDPEGPLRTGQWIDGANLGGHGPRRFKSLDEFLAEIKPWYTPVDWVWQYGKWHFEDWRQETLALPECRIRWSVKMDVAQQLLEPVGEVPDAEAANVRELKQKLLAPG